MPAHSEPSRSKNFTPRTQPTIKSTGSAPIERKVACSIGGISGSANLMAIWLNPQDTHSTSINMMATGLSGRPASRLALLDDISSLGPRRYFYAAFWQCAQVPVISTTDSFGAKPEARAAADRLCATGAAGISPTEPQRSQIRNATIAAAAW